MPLNINVLDGNYFQILLAYLLPGWKSVLGLKWMKYHLSHPISFACRSVYCSFYSILLFFHIQNVEINFYFIKKDLNM